MHREFGLLAGQYIADLGAGTGISAELFLSRGCTVFAVEPNEAMRAAASSRLGAVPGFHSVAGTAEATTLPDHCVDWVVAAQAFHWFDVPRARVEALRILRPGGRAALLWNNRREDTSFLREFEALLHRHATDYQQVKHQTAEHDGRIERFFGPAAITRRTFPNEQLFDYDGLLGRVRSSSYMPDETHPAYARMAAELHALFDRHQTGGQVAMLYETRLYVGAPVA
jgi:SAM-dependent methyltransferase